MAGEALDIPTLSVLALLIPQPTVDQVVFRVIRGKFQLFPPIIVDFRDNAGIWWKHWKSRSSLYQSEKYDLSYSSASCPTSEDASDDECPFRPSETLVRTRVVRNPFLLGRSPVSDEMDFERDAVNTVGSSESEFICPLAPHPHPGLGKRKASKSAPKKIKAAVVNAAHVSPISSIIPAKGKPTLSKRLNRKLAMRTAPYRIVSNRAQAKSNLPNNSDAQTTLETHSISDTVGDRGTDVCPF